MTLARDDVTVKVEVPVGFLDHDFQRHRRILLSDYHGNSSHTSMDKGLISLNTYDLITLLTETSDCREITFNTTKANYVGSGLTKAVYRGQLRGQPVAVKIVDEGMAFHHC